MASNSIFGQWSLSDNGNVVLRTADVTYVFRGCKTRGDAEKLLKSNSVAKEEWVAPNGRSMVTIKETTFGTVDLSLLERIRTVDELRQEAENKLLALIEG